MIRFRGPLLRAAWPGLIAIGSICAIGARLPYVDGPQPGTTGGFEEPTCAECHFDVAQPDPRGMLKVSGLPESYRPGKRYLLTIELRRPGMRRAGFQLAVRSPDGRQAGRLRPIDDRAAVVAHEGIDYAFHTRSGAELGMPDKAVWYVEWEAPVGSRQAALLHGACNAADGDDSPFGDHIYTYTAGSAAPSEGWQ